MIPLLSAMFLNVANSQTCFNRGTGSNGAYSAVANTSIAGGEYNFTSFNIASGVTVNVTGTSPLIIHCQDSVIINGTLQANGGNGTDGVAHVSGGIAGVGVAGGANGGDGSFASSSGPITGGFGSGQGGLTNQGDGWSGGGGAGYSTTGDSSGSVSGGFGGLQYGTLFLTQLDPGSGGGGGSGGFDCGAGGGGAGGGLIVINAGSIVIGATGIISCDGGDGGSDGSGNCGGGGGGSGGALWLAAPSFVLDGVISAIGGTGGGSSVAGSPYYGTGANGADGRIRLDYNGSIIGSGSCTPAAGYHTSRPAQEPSISITSTLSCFGANNGTATAILQGAVNPIAYIWSPVSGSTSTINGLALGDYICQVTDTAYCQLSDTVTITENPAIDVSTTISAGEISANAVSSTFQWLNCSSAFAIIGGETVQDFTYSSNGSYAVEVTTNGCADTSACVDISNFGINNPTNDASVAIYPNPGTGLFFIDLPESALVQVMNLSGLQLFETTMNKGSQQIDLSLLANGVYWVKISSPANTVVVRLIKM